ncbi:hypothetical protein G6L12_05870 [Agrobacterium rhizogenes]|nr:hypothetical protein [Rhizobium rhizogenes]NTF74002.1 hypothetical protein [Rhizobium rhizogenes]
MAKTKTYFHAFNIGVHDRKALPRVDLERMRLAAEDQTNILCQATGPGFMRPGTQYLTPSYAGAECRLKEFIFGTTDAALFEFSNQALRIFVDDAVITRPAVSSTVINGDFSSSAGWSTAGVGGGQATIGGGILILNAMDIEGIAQCSRSVTTATPNVEHALRIIVLLGPVIFRCGSTSSGDEYISETSLPTGVHSLTFTPTGTYYVQFSSKARMNRVVDSIQVEAAGEMILPTPWTLSDLPNVRVDQSADVCFVACDNFQQRRIERRAPHSWSVGLYVSDDGPFALNPDPTVRLKNIVVENNGTMLASAPYFTPEHVGSLFRLVHTGQKLQQGMAQEDVYTDAIRVSGVYYSVGNSDRDFLVGITGTWSGTLTLQRSIDTSDTGFTDVTTYTSNGTYSVSDTASNVIYYYRVGFKVGGYISGEANVSIVYEGGGGTGVCRVVGFNSATSVNIEVVSPMKGNDWTRDWRAGEWSNDRGWPSAVALSDGRLWWSGADRIWGSVSDAFTSFDEDVEGDSGPIARAIATGGVNDTKWMMSLQRLLVGTEGTVSTVKSSSLDEPLTPTNFGIRDSSTTGVASVNPIKIDTRGIFVERAGNALMELTFDGSVADYRASQISKLTTDLFGSGVKSISVQRRPDTRIWIVLNDGTCACMVYEPDQEVLAFIPINTDGMFESVAVLPDIAQDRVYFSIKRTINGSDVRYIEKMAADVEVMPSTLCKTVDSFKSGVNSPASTMVAVGTHLTGKDVVVWADGAPIEASYGIPQAFTVDVGGNITLPSPVTNWVAGLPYRARYKSARLAYGGDAGTAMLQEKSVNGVGLILMDFIRQGIKIGASFDDPYRGLDHLPMMADNMTQPGVVSDIVRDEQTIPFAGEWNVDSRVCIEINSPYSACLLGMVLELTTNGQ